jgi:hypothetical protein
MSAPKPRPRKRSREPAHSWEPSRSRGMATRYKYTVKCTQCRPAVSFRSDTSEKVAMDQLNRHIRENHKKGNAEHLRRRRQQQAARNKVRKAAVKHDALRACGLKGVVAVTACRVLCPSRRGDNFVTLKKELRTLGLKKVERDLGWDFVTGKNVPQGIPHDSRPYKCLVAKTKWEHVWFERVFLPYAIRRMDADPAVQTIMFFEDDATVRPRVTLTGLMKEVAEAAPSALWCGYFLRAGEARYGSHVLTLTKQSATWLLKYSRSLATPGNEYTHYLGLDTFIYNITQNKELKLHGGGAPIVVSSKPFFGQWKHKFRGRN